MNREPPPVPPGGRPRRVGHGRHSRRLGSEYRDGHVRSRDDIHFDADSRPIVDSASIVDAHVGDDPDTDGARGDTDVGLGATG